MSGYIPDSLPAGTLLGNFKLLKTLGQGGFGITYLAHDTQLKRNVVLKECFPAGISMRDSQTGQILPLSENLYPHYLKALDELKDEARTLASLNHESIVRVYEVFESNGSVFYAMPWLSGGDLQHKLTHDTISPDELECWLCKLLDGLSYLHEHGIYHRDIKPQNILFDEKANPVLIDFGSALSVNMLTQTATQGTFSWFYVSPEQLSGKGSIGPWTDLYSIACVWYELVCGMRVETCIERLVQDDTRPLRLFEQAHLFAKSLILSIDCNLSLRLEERCQSAQDWLCWLKQDKAPKRRERLLSPLSIKLLFAVILFACCVLILSWWLFPRELKKEQVIIKPQNHSNIEDLEADLFQRAYDLAKVDEIKLRREHYEKKFAQEFEQMIPELTKLQEKANSIASEITAMKAGLVLEPHYKELDSESKEAERLKRVALRDFTKKSVKELNSDFNAVEKRGLALVNGFGKSFSDNVIYFNREFTLYDVMEKFPVKNSEEMALLPRVNGKFYSQYNYLYDRDFLMNMRTKWRGDITKLKKAVINMLWKAADL